MNPCHDALKPSRSLGGRRQHDRELTPRGRQRAADIIRRHRLAERLFTDSLALDSESEIEQQACKFEHILSPEATTRSARSWAIPAPARTARRSRRALAATANWQHTEQERGRRRASSNELPNSLTQSNLYLLNSFPNHSSLFLRSIMASTLPLSPRRKRRRPSTPLRKNISADSGDHLLLPPCLRAVRTTRGHEPRRSA